MTALREKLARAICANNVEPSQVARAWRLWLEDADIVLAIIEQSAMVIVPREPTDEMRRAGMECAEREIYSTEGAEFGEASLCLDGEAAIWSALLAAAPKEPTA